MCGGGGAHEGNEDSPTVTPVLRHEWGGVGREMNIQNHGQLPCPKSCYLTLLQLFLKRVSFVECQEIFTSCVL